tara:strand:+ start:111 stop:824 length:714 start_codon:yes stop_codon:yes gene_type:complete
VCPSGTYTVAAGAAACSECIGGTFSGEEGATSAAACQLCEEGKASNGPGAAECEVCEAGSEIPEGSAYCFADGAIPTDEVRAAVDDADYEAFVLWAALTGTLVQDFSDEDGWRIERPITLQCTDVDIKCTLDAQASSSDERRVLWVEGADGVFLVGLIIRGGYREVSGGKAYSKRHPDACAKFACAAFPPPPHPKPPPLRIPNPYPLQGVSSEAGGGGWGVLWRGDLLASFLFQPTN